MIENIIMTLNDVLKIPVLPEYPEINSSTLEPKKFVVFEIVYRQKNDFIDAVTIEFNSYAESKYEAAMIDKNVRHAVEDLIENDQISSIEFGGGSSGDRHDEEMKKYRYRCYYNFYFYEEE